MPVDLSKDIVIRPDGPELHGATPITPSDVQFLSLNEIANAKPDVPIALTGGLWPGVRRPPNVDGRGDETASASREPWVDANGYQVGYLRALFPGQPPVLGYTPDKLGDRAVPYDSLELALIEAWTAGGNYILAVEPGYRQALQRKDPKAVAAWQQLERTGRWLRQNISLFRQTSLPIVTALVEPGAATSEIANLLYRRNAAPSIASAASPPKPDPQNRLALVAANLKPPQPAISKRILEHAEAGTTVVVATQPSQEWWRVSSLKKLRSEPDREFYTLGSGQVVAYRRPIADPSEFALDVIDLITHKQRAVRLWNAPSVIALATNSPKAGERLMHLINYGSPIDVEVQARVQGHFKQAMLLRPDAEPAPLKPARRGSTTEVLIPDLKRLAVIAFGGAD